MVLSLLAMGVSVCDMDFGMVASISPTSLIARPCSCYSHFVLLISPVSTLGDGLFNQHGENWTSFFPAHFPLCENY